MWVEQLQNGKYKFSERYEDPLTGSDRKVSTTLEKNTRQSQKMAREILAQKIGKKLDAALNPSKECTLHDLVQEYLKYQEITVKTSTYTRNFFALKSVMRILGEDILVDRLTARYVNQKFLQSQKAPGTLNEHLKRFKAMIRWGHNNDFVSDISFLNKITGFKDRPHRLKIQDKYLESSELKSVLQDMDNEQWRLITKFMALSGLRFAEFSALKKKNVDLESLQIHIVEGYDSVNKKETSTKNEFSERDVHIQPELLSVCHDINAFMLRRKLMYGLRNCDLFMANKDGRHISYYAFNKYLKDHAERITGKLITPHALRHTHASLLFEQGFSLDEIARRLGHGNSRITKEIYTHVTKSLVEKDNYRLDQVRIL